MSFWIATSLITTMGFVTAVACQRQTPQPTVVVFSLDTVRQDALGCYGNPFDPTPQIDAVARDGVRFDQAISSSGWTLPAVASLLTGTWPNIHGAVGSGIMLKPLRPEVQTAAEVLKANGFSTLGFANAAFVSPMVGIDRGFDVFDHKYSYNHDARQAHLVIDAAIRELHAHLGEPTFFFIHLFDPHLTYAPPPGYDTKYTQGRNSPPPPITMKMCYGMQTGKDKRQPPSEEDIRYLQGVYQGEINFMDAHVGRFIAELKALGLYDQATVVLISDHGEEFWEHGGFEHGHTFYDELVRVPLIVKFPLEVEPVQRVVSTQVRVVDVMPSVVEVLGIDPPASFEGESMMPLVRGGSEDDRPAFCESLLYGEPKIAWRSERYKYIQEAATGREGMGELYDWREDPAETQNLAEQRPDIARQMRSELFDFYDELLARSRRMSNTQHVNMSPMRIQELRTLGYIR
jgi:arylsulfatase A-like enzyme